MLPIDGEDATSPRVNGSHGTQEPARDDSTPAVAELVATGDTPAAFAAECVALLRDPARASSLGAEGRRRVTLDYSWDAAARRLRELMDDPSGSAGSRSPGTPTDSAEVARSACALP